MIPYWPPEHKRKQKGSRTKEKGLFASPTTTIKEKELISFEKKKIMRVNKNVFRGMKCKKDLL